MEPTQQQTAPGTHKDLQGAAALAQMRDIVKEAENCFFCIHADAGQPLNSRPMNVRRIDDDGTLWFLSSGDSFKNRELQGETRVELFFQAADRSGFLHLAGEASVSRDRQTIDELWTAAARNWFPQGKDDPRLTAIRVRPDSGHYWDSQHGDLVAGLKMYIGAVTGQPQDVGVEGGLKPH